MGGPFRDQKYEELGLIPDRVSENSICLPQPSGGVRASTLLAVNGLNGDAGVRADGRKASGYCGLRIADCGSDYGLSVLSAKTVVYFFDRVPPSPKIRETAEYAEGEPVWYAKTNQPMGDPFSTSMHREQLKRIGPDIRQLLERVGGAE